MAATVTIETRSLPPPPPTLPFPSPRTLASTRMRASGGGRPVPPAPRSTGAEAARPVIAAASAAASVAAASTLIAAAFVAPPPALPAVGCRSPAARAAAPVSHLPGAAAASAAAAAAARLSWRGGGRVAWGGRPGAGAGARPPRVVAVAAGVGGGGSGRMASQPPLPLPSTVVAAAAPAAAGLAAAGGPVPTAETGEVSTGNYVDAHVPAADASASGGGGGGDGDIGGGGGGGVGGHPPPTHLLLLVHGLHGTPEDFDAIIDCVSSRPRRRAPPGTPPPLVHATRVNHRRTADGVASGGRRVAADVCALAAAHPSLTHLSMVGFSLGGLYARYAVAALYDPRSGRLAGGRLTPHTFVGVASPMLGVRCFGLMRFLPTFLQAGATVLFGATGAELMLQDRRGGGGSPPSLP